jgi:hypothetical protein
LDMEDFEVKEEFLQKHILPLPPTLRKQLDETGPQYDARSIDPFLSLDYSSRIHTSSLNHCHCDPSQRTFFPLIILSYRDRADFYLFRSKTYNAFMKMVPGESHSANESIVH